MDFLLPVERHKPPRTSARSEKGDKPTLWRCSSLAAPSGAPNGTKNVGFTETDPDGTRQACARVE